jgi:hypothetical protein
MSRGPQVLNMEYREPYLLEPGPGEPIFLLQCLHLVSSSNIHPISLVLQQQWVFIHEVMSPGIMVCVTMILKIFQYVNLIIFSSHVCLDFMPFHLSTPGGNDRIP